MSKLTEDELKQLNDYNNKYSNILASIGALEVQKTKFLVANNTLQDLFTKFTDDLKKKYGDGVIDLKTGEITLEETKNI